MAQHSDVAKAAEVAADARQRAWRTLWQGVATDALFAAVMAVSAIVATDVQWTRAYWSALGLLVGKTVVQALVASVARRVVPPSTL